MSAGPPVWRLGHGLELTLDRPRLLAIVNVTPDSFSDGGSLPTVDDAVERIEHLVGEGADMLDIGGESTRPGAAPVDEGEQARRVVPVIEAARRRGVTVPISVDTTRSAVARAALSAGANAVNDQSAGTDDPAMFALVAERAGAIVLMHRLRAPGEDRYSTAYPTAPEYEGGVVGVVRSFLEARAHAALRAGVTRESVVIDPGLGFGKSVAQNFELIRRTPEIASVGFPVLSAASRKSFIGRASGVEEPALRVEGSVAVSVAHWLAGARLFRVHDVAEHRRALGVAASIAPGAPESGAE